MPLCLLTCSVQFFVSSQFCPADFLAFLDIVVHDSGKTPVCSVLIFRESFGYPLMTFGVRSGGA